MTDAISEGASYCNDAQVIAVEHAVKDVLGSHPAKSVAVISPYAGQIAILRERLPEGLNDVLKQLPRTWRSARMGMGLSASYGHAFSCCASSETISLLRAICKSHSEPSGSASTNT